MAPKTKILSAPVKTYLADSMLTVGLDIGYGVVKAVTAAGAAAVFPSVYGQARAIKFRQQEIAAKYPGDQIADDEGDWFVGNLALSQLGEGEQLYLRGRSSKEASIGNEVRVRLAKVALGKLLPGKRADEVVHLRIATGLPVDHMPKAHHLKESLIGQHRIKTDQTDFVANITEVMIMPQPYGTIYSQSLTPQGEVNPAHTAERTAVVDIGTYSVDITLDDRGEYIDRFSGTAESGIYLAQDKIASIFEEIADQKPTYGEIENILRTRQQRIKGHMEDFDQAVEEAIEPIYRATLKKMQERWGAAATIDVIYLSGGGAYLIADRIQKVYSQAVLVVDAQLANARGYLNYALLVEKNGNG